MIGIVREMEREFGGERKGKKRATRIEQVTRPSSGLREIGLLRWSGGKKRKRQT